MSHLPPRVLMVVDNLHRSTDGSDNWPPDFDGSGTDYVAYTQNTYGEQMFFVQRSGEPSATIYHGDNAWVPVPIAFDANEPCGIALDEAESMFALACWLLSESWRRES